MANYLFSTTTANGTNIVGNNNNIIANNDIGPAGTFHPPKLFAGSALLATTPGIRTMLLPAITSSTLTRRVPRLLYDGH
jgi:hypothetical protein